MRGQLVALLQTFLLPILLIFLLPRFLDYFGLEMMSSRRGGAGGGGGYRPRNTLTRALINKLNSEREARELAAETWYSVNLQHIKDEEIRAKFVQLSADEETNNFIESSIEKSDWIFTQIYHNFAKAFLSIFYTQTDINGILQRGSMFVLSRDQFLKLTDGISGEKMIDLGAGDGKPTMSMIDSFESVYATEASDPMRSLLKAKNIQVVEVENWVDQGPFDLISCLNLLDRADNPVTILNSVKSSLKQSGLLLVSLVLPFKPYVEFNPPTHKPSENLGITGANLEEQLESAVKEIESVGFELLRWSRVPYLCEGDLNQSIYHLPDFVMIFKPK